MASGRSRRIEDMPWCIPNVFPRGDFYITYRPCYCGNEMIVVPIPMYPAPSPWPACYYPPSSCVTNPNCECRECCPNKERPPFYSGDPNIVKSNVVLPVYPSYPPDEPRTLSNSRRSRKNRRKAIAKQAALDEKNGRTSGSSDVDR